MDKITKLYMIHDFTEYLIERGEKEITLELIDNYILYIHYDLLEELECIEAVLDYEIEIKKLLIDYDNKIIKEQE